MYDSIHWPQQQNNFVMWRSQEKKKNEHMTFFFKLPELNETKKALLVCHVMEKPEIVFCP